MTENTNDKFPTHGIYKVMGDGSDGQWTKVGVAFPHKDGKGLALIFDAIPIEGRIALRALKPKPVQKPNAALVQDELPLPPARPTIKLPDPLRRMP